MLAGADVVTRFAALGSVVGAGQCPFCAISARYAPLDFTVCDAQNAVIIRTAQSL